MSGSGQSPVLSSYSGKVQTVEGMALPGVNIAVLSGTISGPQEVDTTTQPGSPLAAIYSDPYGEYQIAGSVIVSDDQGNFEFWAEPGYYVLQYWGAGIFQIINGETESQYLQGISIGGEGGGGGGGLGPVQTGNGSSGNVVLTTLKGTGGGPNDPTTVVGYAQVTIGLTTYWVPLLQ